MIVDGAGTIEKDGQCLEATAKLVLAAMDAVLDEACACKDMVCFDAAEERFLKVAEGLDSVLATDKNGLT